MDNDITKSYDIDSSFQSAGYFKQGNDQIIKEISLIDKVKDNDLNFIEDIVSQNSDDDNENLQYYEETEDEKDNNEAENNSFTDQNDLLIFNNQETSESIENICLSPPQSNRTIKKEAASKNRKSKHNTKMKSLSKHKTKPKRPIFKNSAANLLLPIDNDLITDSLTNMQDEHIKAEQLEIFGNNHSMNNNQNFEIHTLSPLQTNALNTNYNYWININSNSLDQKKHEKVENLLLYNNMDPSDRFKCYEKISSLLKLALRTHQTKQNFIRENYISTKVPPCTPATTSIQTSNNKESIFNQTIYSRQASSNKTNFSEEYCYKTQFSSINEQIKQNASVNAEKIFKYLYDFFVHFDDRAENEDIVDFRIKEARKIIPLTIEDIINTNFGAITCHIDNEIFKSMKSPCDYSLLYEHKSYIDQLCYVYWLVEDILNRITYIETLYPSTKAMRKDQPDYANEKFDSTYKTLLLWYKIMTGLMNSCDILGKYLGFSKKPEYFQYWTWFEQRLTFSKNEYESVQNWISQSFQDIIPSLGNNPNCYNEASNLNSSEDNFKSNSTLIDTTTVQNDKKSISFKHINKDFRQVLNSNVFILVYLSVNLRIISL